MMMHRRKRKVVVFLVVCALFIGGCASQASGETNAIEAAKEKVETLGTEPRLIATSPAVAAICDRLELDLVGVCSTSVSTIPERYKELPDVGTAMSPDMEVIASLNPDWILSPSSLRSDLEPKYEAIHTDWAFLNLRSVKGMYQSIHELGEIFGKEEKAAELEKEFQDFYEKYKTVNENKKHPKVLILMGLRDLISLQQKILMWEAWWKWQVERMYMPVRIRSF